MPRNGAGVYTLPAGNPVVTGTTISSTVQNNTMSDVGVALTNSIAKDGQTVATANLPMGGFRHTGVSNGVLANDYAALGQSQNAVFQVVSSISGVDTITGAMSPTLTSYVAGQTFRFVSAGANTGAVTINIDSLGAKAVTKFGATALAAGDIPSGSVVQIYYDGTQFQLSNLLAQAISTSATATTQSVGDNSTKIATTAYVDRVTTLRGYIDGLIMSTAGSSTTMTIAAGDASDSTNAMPLRLASSISKTTSSWAVGSGNGGLDTGAIANSTWYYFYVIRRPDTGVVDVVFSTNTSTPTLPANYTQYRYIGAGLTNGSGQWTAFIQIGDDFYWGTPTLDFSGAGSATAALLTCNVPRGRKVKAYFNVFGDGSATGAFRTYISSPDVADLAPGISAAPLSTIIVNGSANDSIGAGAVCWTNTSAQVRHRELNTNTLQIATLGWMDPRGKN